MDKKKKKVILVIGGDLRQTYLCNILAKKARVYAIGCRKAELSDDVILFDYIDEIPEQVDYMILPIPVTNDGVNINIPFSDEKISLYSTIPFLKHNAVVFGGKIGTEGAIFTYKGFEVIDYLEREELSVMNAIPVVFLKVQKNSRYNVTAVCILHLKGFLFSMSTLITVSL